MADKKISALDPATIPLAGTEVLPIVQSGATVKVSVANLTAGRALDTTSVNKVAITAPVTGATLTIAEGKTLTASNSLTFAGTDATTMTFPTTSATVARTDAANSFTGDQTLATGNIIQGTAAKGVNFTANTPAAGMTRQLLNWYEEGTFTPTIIGTTAAGVGTYIVQIGRYTRVGRQVSFDLEVAISAHTGTGNMRISGLPFTANAVAFAAVCTYANNLTLTAGNIPAFLLAPNTILIYMNQIPTGGGAGTAIPMDTVCNLVVSGVYTV